MKEKITKDEAKIFFSCYFQGEHHFPGKIIEWGDGYAIRHTVGIATFDFNRLTWLVVAAHDLCYRVEIVPKGMSGYYICVWKRLCREGSLYERHPLLESHATSIRMGEQYQYMLKQLTTE